MHSKGFAHLDLKHDNILIDGEMNAKICDFGFSLKMDSNGCTESRKCTIQYAAPELVKFTGPFNGAKADIFALGVVLFSGFTMKFLDENWQTTLYS